jgi:hypothetical protein
MNEPTISEMFEEVLRRLDTIERKLKEKDIPDLGNTKLGSTRCLKCGMVWDGIMSYYCADMNCPVQYKTTAYNISTTTSTLFDVESLDPDQRTWYYDGDGTRRKKE